MAENLSRRRPTGLVRREPFDGLTPVDFVAPAGTWPEGPFVRVMEARIPRNLRPEEQSEAVREARMVQDAVLELASEVQDYVRWRKRKRLPVTVVAREAGVSRARITALEQGANWPRWDLLMRLRVVRDNFDYG